MIATENTRNFSNQPIKILTNVFGCAVKGFFDAVPFSDGRVFGICGLPFYTPCANYVINDIEVYKSINGLAGSFLISVNTIMGNGGVFSVSGDSVFLHGRRRAATSRKRIAARCGSY